ncbi:hypothetical protein GGR95_000943 [Sulfitobacter undariae]|uniref:Uncharacterized protein n=1 Tax=Sulfitobacter undariae TaxID=1563671 RepID=A0A7W6E785_9RHOB|nr:hypothetical protein [Sulfitobacter undariae]
MARSHYAQAIFLPRSEQLEHCSQFAQFELLDFAC